MGNEKRYQTGWRLVKITKDPNYWLTFLVPYSVIRRDLVLKAIFGPHNCSFQYFFELTLSG